ncbi:hypothetical protein DOY81_001767 [Sarcophaga bullata]|nr:hypothetical protein DOY81_001767 [Sarcophaga bullata]
MALPPKKLMLLAIMLVAHRPTKLPITLTYMANENGFHPSGEHFPTPSTVPVAIVKALEYIRTHCHQENLSHLNEVTIN